MFALPTAVMHASNPSGPELRLTLKSQLADLTLVWSWVEALAAHHSLSAETQFAIQLCLQEALSNVIRHGYSGQADQPITVECASTSRGEIIFVVEDHAPPFDPLAHPHAGQAPAPASIAELEPGGQGIRLMRGFAHRAAYQRLPNGNRLTLAFTLPH
jgi:anti-sigma regulatory factor (Ser/Thr protein kinase)